MGEPDATLVQVAGELEVVRQERDGLQTRLNAAEALRKGLPVCPLLLVGKLMLGKSLSRHRGDGDTRIEKECECFMERCGAYQAGLCQPKVGGKAAKAPKE